MSFSKTPPEFDYYTISRALGEGEIGTVYLAQDRRTDRPVAIKVISVRVFDPELKARLLSETRNLTALKHSNVARCHEIAESRDGVPSIVTEYVEGVDLRAFEGRAWPELLPLMIQTLSGLAYLRSQHVVHGDLSSNNILVTLENRKRVAKILDFGVAEILKEQAPEGDGRTLTGQSLGKLAFASPEMILSATVDWRTDVYSLGVVFHRLLAGKPPIAVARSSNYFDWLMAHQKERVYEVEAPPDLPRLPAGLKEVVRRMLARNPDDRPQSYEEILDVLDRVQLEMTPDLAPDPLTLETLPTFPPSRTPLSVEESQQKRWPDLEKTIGAAAPQSPSVPEAPVERFVPPPPPASVKTAPPPTPEESRMQTEVPVWRGGAAKGLPAAPVSSGPDLVQDKTERLDDVIAKLKQQSAAGLPPAPPPPPPERRPETATASSRAAERAPTTPPASERPRLVIYGEPPPPPVPPPARAAPPVAAPAAPAPVPDAGGLRTRWIGIGLIVAAIVILFVAVLWGLVSLLRGAATGGATRSSLGVPTRTIACANNPSLYSMSI